MICAIIVPIANDNQPIHPHFGTHNNDNMTLHPQGALGAFNNNNNHCLLLLHQQL
jgi:hypothetical protein